MKNSHAHAHAHAHAQSHSHSLLALALALAFVPSLAHADLEDEMGVGPEVAALGNAVTAVPVGFASVHYGPAFLAPRGMRPGTSELTIGYVYGQPLVHVTSDGGMQLPTCTMPTGGACVPPTAETSSVIIGGRFDLGHALGLEGLAFGLSISTPVTSLFSYSVRPDDDIQWMTLTDGSRHLSLEAGLAYRPVDWLSIGVAARLGLAVSLYTTAAETSIDTTTMPGTIIVHTDIGAQGQVSARMSPIASIAIMPMDELRFGITYRAANYIDDWGWSRVQGVPNFADIGYVHHFAHWVRPHELAIGASGRPTPWLELSADLTWQHWSEAMTGNHDAATGRFGDTFVPAGGARFTALHGLDVMIGYSFVRAPFQNFGGPSNLLINDTHHASIGAAARLDELTHDPSLTFTLRASFRLSILEEAHETKDPRHFYDQASFLANPGYPGYGYGGFVPSVQLAIEARW
jgi:long-subunit fatty acid transport protein